MNSKHTPEIIRRKVDFYVDILEFLIAERELLLDREGSEVAGVVLHTVRQAIDGLDS